MLAELYNLGTGDTFAQTGQYDQHQNIFELPWPSCGIPARKRRILSNDKGGSDGGAESVSFIIHMKAKTIVYQENNPYFCEAKIKAEDISDITSGMQSAYKKYFYER